MPLFKADAAGKPYFRVHRITSDFVIGTQTVIQFNSTIDDSATCWDGTNFRFVPNKAGRYLFGSSIQFKGSAATAGTALFSLYLFKNGTRVSEQDRNPPTLASTFYESICFASAISMNGTTDYVDMRATNNASTPAVGAGSLTDQATWFEGHYLGPL